MQPDGGGFIRGGIIKGRFKHSQAPQLFIRAQRWIIGDIIRSAHKAIKAQHLRADFRRQ
jgi:hypothetical protein